ncbi:hypothetical protein FG99_02295 [Pseudomonas sp. AAC]|uniref:hypothetical protein n=1 Tax=Pseudomonas sp. HMSC75E02 TaxID=1608908 RepID=UPI0004D829CE|nr:hypothetical protein FG99_02295 [Pseudomonas sp. AAC]OHR81130.1 hypothetical protein HMPREF3289_28795 [Pseudomonas sp. HMSC75E02]
MDFKRLSEAGVDGFFTNRADRLLAFYGRPAAKSVGGDTGGAGLLSGAPLFWRRIPSPNLENCMDAFESTIGISG